VTLIQVPVGTTARLADTAGHPSSRRLAELGIRPGADIRVMRRTSGGGRLIGVGHSRMALDSTTLQALHVELPG
jgi:ferrous iron transport protein A